MLHCTFLECRAKRLSRNCSSGDKGIAVRWTSQNRHRGNERGWGICLPREILACHRYLLGWDRDRRRLASSLCLPHAILSLKPQSSVLHPSAVLASFVSFPIPTASEVLWDSRYNNPRGGYRVGRKGLLLSKSYHLFICPS